MLDMKTSMHLISQNSDFQSHFSVLKISRMFQKKSFKNIGLGDQLLLKNIFENFDFKILYYCAQVLSALFIILVGLTMTGFSEKMLVSTRCIRTWFRVQIDQKILDGL